MAPQMGISVPVLLGFAFALGLQLGISRAHAASRVGAAPPAAPRVPARPLFPHQWSARITEVAQQAGQTKTATCDMFW